MKLHLGMILGKIVMAGVLVCLVLAAFPAQVFASGGINGLSPFDQRRLKRVELRCSTVKQQLTDSTKMLEQATAVRPGFVQFINDEKSKGFATNHLDKLLVAFDQQVALTTTQRAEGLAFLADTSYFTSNCEVVDLEPADLNSYRAMLRMAHIQNGFNLVYRQIYFAMNVYKLGVDTETTLPHVPAHPVSVANQDHP